MNHISSIYEENEIIISLSILCNNFELEEDKIKCVNHFVQEYFDYDSHDEERKLFRTPNEIINDGGCCRDWSVFYNSIFSLMDFETEFIYEPKHVYLKICNENCYHVDQRDYWVVNDSNIL